MQRRKLGSLDVSVIGIGTNNFGTNFFGAGCDQDTTTAIVNAALESGINYFDTAEEYSIPSPLGEGRSEQFLGKALGRRRDDVVIATKFLVTDHEVAGRRGAARIERAVEASLRRLGTDRIDLYQQHTPDPHTPLEETLTALDRLVRAGKVREIGCSNFDGALIRAADDISRDRGLARFVSVQNSHSVLDAGADTGSDAGGPGSTGAEESLDDMLDRRPQGYVQACTERGLALIPYFPLVNGLLTGKYRRGAPAAPDSRLGSSSPISQALAPRVLSEANFDIVEQLDAYAGDHGHTLIELALSWLVSQPVVATVIAGVTRPEQAAQNAAAASWALDAADFDAIEKIVRS